MSAGPITTPNRFDLSTWLTSAGATVSRYGLVIVLAWIGYGKYVKMEARVLIEHSPLMSWIYHFLSAGAVAAALGTAEIIAAVLIALRPLWPKVSAVGSAMAVVLFLGTVSFLFTTPGLTVGQLARNPDPGRPAWPVSAEGRRAVGCRTVDSGRITGCTQKSRRDSGSDWCLIGEWLKLPSVEPNLPSGSNVPKHS